jgi:hypothetical protein
MDREGKKKPANLFRLRVKKTSLEAFGLIAGAGGRNRTDTGSPPLDFESSASTSFTTPAGKLYIAYILLCSQAKALKLFQLIETIISAIS